jgi:4-hydroxy-tetrahydrodipicolinate synthase
VQIVVEQEREECLSLPAPAATPPHKAIQLTKRAKRVGADGVLSVGPYCNKPTQQGFYEHFKAIAECEAIPVIVYNVPGRTGSNIEAKTMLRLAEVPNIVAVKEASGNLGQMMDIIRDAPQDFSRVIRR